MTDYIAVSRGGDLPGMAGHEVSMPIHNKEQLRLWRNFNKCAEIFHSAFMLHQYFSEELGKSYGEEWTKWHTRTSWVVKRNGR